ncbi:hypothetical protein C3495_06330 [Clostridiaceae bacterium 14S0207]|nr:hypothetical protein C3495_06330 [Clostridiaceae bacterium 14S0207]
MIEPLIITTDYDLTGEQLTKIKEELNGLNAIILPKGFKKVVQEPMLYKVFTREDFRKYRLSKLKVSTINRTTIKHINEYFNKLSKGHKFLIGVSAKDETCFYSVEYFENHVLNNGNDK